MSIQYLNVLNETRSEMSLNKKHNLIECWEFFLEDPTKDRCTVGQNALLLDKIHN